MTHDDDPDGPRATEYPYHMPSWLTLAIWLTVCLTAIIIVAEFRP